jgi:NAD-dependent dihydropyrimidine dehydrogenase PreA subunit
MAKRIAVIVSQGASSHPDKRQLEEDIVTGLMLLPGLEVTVIPSLYDLKPDSTGMLALQGIGGDMVIFSWMFERAAHWILDRNAISGQMGTTLLRNSDEEEDEEEEPGQMSERRPRVIESRQLPGRRIWCIDLRITNSPQPYLDEVLRIQKELQVAVVSLGTGLQGNSPTSAQMTRFENPANTTALSLDGNGLAHSTGGILKDAFAGDTPSASVNRIADDATRRWYPVIDYSRCTNCLECIDFCLFGVYGIDRIDTILVEQPDNCRKGCPACSRVCPENAIIFPQHKTPAIAGSAEVGGSLKIDLSQLFGAPDQGKSAAEIAALERDEQLVMAGRPAVGTQGLQGRQRPNARSTARDELDDLVDQLDGLDL